MNDERRQESVGFLGTLRSVLSAFFGVQSESNRARDFEKGNPVHFIAIALIATVGFVLVMWGIVSVVLGLATG
ncbi:MAG: DUF2970 domain-containing protein [Gammaproteobacteria bacterium]|nr:DUF2970 domain-containing protein [Gammaproteobacteria bacterium]MDX5501940.1 DUF2970 domain-containing protein [Halomonas sp.]